MEVLIRWLQTEAATDLCHAMRLDSEMPVSRGRGGELDVISEESPYRCVCASRCMHMSVRWLYGFAQSFFSGCIIYTIPTAGLPSLAVLVWQEVYPGDGRQEPWFVCQFFLGETSMRTLLKTLRRLAPTRCRGATVWSTIWE